MAEMLRARRNPTFQLIERKQSDRCGKSGVARHFPSTAHVGHVLCPTYLADTLPLNPSASASASASNPTSNRTTTLSPSRT